MTLRNTVIEVFTSGGEERVADLDTQNTGLEETVQSITDKFENEILMMRRENKRLKSEGVALKRLELESAAKVTQLEEQLKAREMRDIVHLDGKRGREEAAVEEEDDREEEEEEQEGEGEGEMFDEEKEDNANGVGKLARRVAKTKSRGPSVGNKLTRSYMRLEDIEVVNTDESTVLVNDYITHKPHRAKSSNIASNRAIYKAIKNSIPSLDPQELSTLVQGVGSAFMAEDAANAAFLTLLQQIFAAASAAISFRQLAVKCRDQYVSNRQRKLGRRAGSPILARLVEQPGFKAVVFKKIKTANEAVCGALARNNRFYDNNFHKCVSVGQFVIDLVDIIGPGVAFRFLRDTNLSYSTLQTMTTGQARDSYLAELRSDPYRQTCKEVYSSARAAQATEKAWKDLGFKQLHGMSFCEAVARLGATALKELE
ncbi:hypothetical protein DFS34DRAFT_692289 [Phlyctochytrium arcticum]|nr:hypothetical protein DFS34DRAFT_692289 [Phlyctochytrium arcticum]